MRAHAHNHTHTHTRARSDLAGAQSLMLNYSFDSDLNASSALVSPMSAAQVLVVTNASDPKGPHRLRLVVPPSGYKDDANAFRMVFNVSCALARGRALAALRCVALRSVRRSVGRSSLSATRARSARVGARARVLALFGAEFRCSRQVSVRVGLEITSQEPPAASDGVNSLRFVKNVGFWVGFRFLVDSWTPVPQTLMPILLFRTSESDEARISIASNGSAVAFENRYQQGKRPAATRSFAPLQRGAWQHVTLFMRRSENNGTLRVWFNSENVLNVTNAAVGVFPMAFEEDPYMLLTVDGGFSSAPGVVPPPDATPVGVEVYFDSLRVAQTELASGRSLVEPDVSKQCPLGGNACYCRDSLTTPCDGDRLICVRTTVPGYCTGVTPGFTTCKFLGVDQCPCSAGLCAPGLTCRSLTESARALCHNITTPAPAPGLNATAEEVW